jgi:shikimate dehydrogenase
MSSSSTPLLDQYAVVGNPVGHSLSPRIHAWFAAQTAERMTYGRLLAPLEGFRQTVERFFAEGGRGLNVTVPFKTEAAAWVHDLDPQARLAGAVNTIRADQGRYLGFNTDGTGLIRDLERNQGETLRGRRVLLVGAGGAARGVTGPLLDAGPAELVIANRTLDKAQALVAGFDRDRAAGRLRASGLSNLETGFDVVINATSAGLGGEVAAIPVAAVRDAFCYDMIYGSTTAFCAFARAGGARQVMDGIGMLVEQAAEAFRIWRGVLPDTAALLLELRRERDEPADA